MQLRPWNTYQTVADLIALGHSLGLEGRAAVKHEQIVVTGAGCVSTLGHSVEAFWSAPQDGRYPVLASS